KLRMTREQVLERVRDSVAFARSFVEDVEFSCEDAGRTDWGFMVEIVAAVIEAGATTINLPDTVGYCQPEQYGAMVAYILANVQDVAKATISVHCHNDLGLAVANSLAAVRNGARQIECTINGIGERAGNASLEEIVMNLITRKDYFGVQTNVNPGEIYRCSKLVQQITGQRVQANKAIVGANAFAHEAGIHQDGVIKHRSTYEIMTPESVGWSGESMVMGKHSGRHAFKSRLESLGFTLSDEELQAAFRRFKDLCDKKKKVYDEDLYAIVDDSVKAGQVIWELVHAQATSGTGVVPTGTVILCTGGCKVTDTGTGDGPVDAIFKSIERCVGVMTELKSYSLDSVTEGKDAQGRVIVILKQNGFTAKGVGVDTDIVVASAKAFVNALNTIAFQEARAGDKIAPVSPQEA
ncbi:MAG: 2-isopropylmalate synthase, partial [Candidatus Buchananbacteria bacterium]|nr:2-isopropylmalate synthase [Candidatus Buchananbacteria bacterium]